MVSYIPNINLQKYPKLRRLKNPKMFETLNPEYLKNTENIVNIPYIDLENCNVPYTPQPLADPNQQKSRMRSQGKSRIILPDIWIKLLFSSKFDVLNINEFLKFKSF